MSTFAERFAWIEKERGLSRNGLCTKAGVARSYVRNLIKAEEERKAIRPGAAQLEKLARAADVSVVWLTSGKGEPGRYGTTPANEARESSPPPPPVSDIQVSNDAQDALLNDSYDKDEHTPTDMVVAKDALRLGAALLKGQPDPKRFARLLLDLAARTRKRGGKARPQDLPWMAMTDLSAELDAEREENKRLRYHVDLAKDWLKAHDFEIPQPGEGPHEALLEAREALLGIPAGAKAVPKKATTAGGKPKRR